MNDFELTVPDPYYKDVLKKTMEMLQRALILSLIVV